MSDHHHGAPANPYLEKRRNGVATAELEARVKKIEALIISKGQIDQIVDTIGSVLKQVA